MPHDDHIRAAEEAGRYTARVSMPRRWAAGVLAALLLAPLVTSQPATAEQAKPGETLRDCKDVCPEMVVVPAGSFLMGSKDELSEGPQRQVTIGRPLAVGKFEVTFDEWQACVAAKGCTKREHRDRGWGRGRRPVIDITWHDAKAYTQWLSRKTGKSYRLLTEAEWEYAARAGTTTLYSWGDEIGTDNANCEGCGGEWNGRLPAPVGSYKANAFGLHDMLGNVWEWVEDCWQRGHEGSPTDGSARTTGCPDPSQRVTRGGAFLHGPGALRSTVRNNYTDNNRANGIGFRVARDL